MVLGLCRTTSSFPERKSVGGTKRSAVLKMRAREMKGIWRDWTESEGCRQLRKKSFGKVKSLEGTEKTSLLDQMPF